MILEYRKAFWVALLSLALLSASAALWLFPRALPMLQLQVSLSRDQALAAAQALQEQRFTELNTTRAVARFDHDGELQNYIELEGGGLDAYTRLLGERFVAPYFWTVRRFSESQEDELSVRFTPQGDPYGFVRKLPEKAPGAALDEAAARVIAEAGARSLLGDSLWAAYVPLTASNVTRPGARVDHSFVYEHGTEKRGDARFRLKLVVAGDRLVEVTPYAFVPQAFTQRFAQLRTGNESIAKAANIALFSLFGLGGLFGGWLWLARHGALAWRPALVCAGMVGALAAAALLSNLPMSWFGYATTDSANNFLLRQAAMAAAAAVATTLALGLVFAVAEGLSRRAFAPHPALFKLWSLAAGSSWQVLGRTLGGYAWMAIELLLVAGFYLVARNQFDWWVPAESLSDPNILSAWRPALEPIAQALQAGTLEEALFRAVPLSAAALLGARLGWRRSAIGVALVLQALVFAGAHANYPGLPSYSRLVELFLPALIWGLIFLRYGLLPCMLMHFTFDLTLMSLPLFVANDPRLWLDRGLVILAGLAPLLMVLRARLRQGGFTELPETLRHGETMHAIADGPAVVPDEAQVAAMVSAAAPVWLRPLPLTIAALLGAAALLLWPAPQISTTPFSLDHAGAVARAEALLAARGVKLDAGWKRLAVVRPAATGDEKSLRFVWREAGPLVFARLLGSAIQPPHWQVLFKHASGPVEERAEVWEVALSGQGTVMALEHQLPEARPGARLNREQAQALVSAFIDGDKALANRPWTLASVREDERPARRDWSFVWEDKQALNVRDGSARLAVTLRGDELAAWQYVFVPEAWEREQQQKAAAKTPFKIAAGVAAAALVLLILGTALRQVVQGTLHWRMGLTWAAFFLVSSMADYALSYDHKAMAFNPAQDWDTQVLTSVAMAVAGFLVSAALIGLLSMRLHRLQRPGNAEVGRDLLRGLGLALFVKGVAAGLQHMVPENSPSMADVGAWDSLQPLLGAVLRGPGNAAALLAGVALMLGAVHFARTRGRALLLGALALMLALASILAAEALPRGLVMLLIALVLALVLWALARRQEVGVLIAFFALAPLTTLPQMLSLPIVNAATHAALSCVVTIALAWWTLRHGRSLGRGGP